MDSLQLKAAIERDQLNLDDLEYPSAHPATVLRVVASVVSTWKHAKDYGDPGLIGVTEMNLRSAALLYERYFPGQK
jgi:hypothetical protein